MANFGGFTEQTAPDLDDFLAGYAAGGGSGSDRRFKIRNLFSQASEVIGIGTPTPLSQLEISASGDSSGWAPNFGGSSGLRITGTLDQSCNLTANAIGSDAQTLVEWLWFRARGTQAAPLGLLDGNTIGQWQVGGYSSVSNFALGGNLVAVCVGNWTGTSVGLKWRFDSARSGSTSTNESLSIYGGSITVGGATDPGAAGRIGMPAGAIINMNGVTINETGGNMFFSGASAGFSFNQAVFPAAGTTGTAPMHFTSGPIMTTAGTGAVEYDGKAFYFTPSGTTRGVTPSMSFISLSANQTGADSATAQTWFPGGGDTGFNVAASTSYFFEGVFASQRSAGTTSHTTGLLFAGTATITSIAYHAGVVGGATAFVAPGGNFESIAWIAVATDTAVTAANTSANETHMIRVKGIVRINGAGTFIPQFKYSAAPGGAPTVQANTWFRMWPVGSNTVLDVN